MPKIEHTNHVATSKELRVEGRTWEGGDSTRVYALRPQDAAPATLAAALRIAGDFASLDSATIVVTESRIKETITRTPLT